MKFMNQAKRHGAKLAVVVAAPLALAAQAYAAIPEEAKTAIEGAKADGIEAGWLVIGAIAALLSSHSFAVFCAKKA